MVTLCPLLQITLPWIKKTSLHGFKKLKKKMHIKSKFLFYTFSTDFVSKFHAHRRFSISKLQTAILSVYDPCPLDDLRSSICSSTIYHFQGSIAILLHLSLRGRSVSSFDLHFVQKNTFGISFRDIWTQVRWYQTVHLSQLIQDQRTVCPLRWLIGVRRGPWIPDWIIGRYANGFPHGQVIEYHSQLSVERLDIPWFFLY